MTNTTTTDYAAIAEHVAVAARILRNHVATASRVEELLVDVADVLAITIDVATRNGQTVDVARALPPAMTSKPVADVVATGMAMSYAAERLQAAAMAMATVTGGGRSWAKATLMASSVAMAIRSGLRP